MVLGYMYRAQNKAETDSAGVFAQQRTLMPFANNKIRVLYYFVRVSMATFSCGHADSYNDMSYYEL